MRLLTTPPSAFGMYSRTCSQAEGWLFSRTSFRLAVPLWSWLWLPLMTGGPFKEVSALDRQNSCRALAGGPALWMKGAQIFCDQGP